MYNGYIMGRLYILDVMDTYWMCNGYILDVDLMDTYWMCNGYILDVMNTYWM